MENHEHGDLDSAIEAAEENLALTPPGHPERGDRLETLRAALERRWVAARARSDLHRAAEVAEEALDLAPLGHPDRGSRLHAMRWVLFELWLTKQRRTDLDLNRPGFGDCSTS